MLTVGRLARRVGLSRSTLLYYDRLGLLCPSARSPAGYRLYDDDDVARLERLMLLREAGLSLSAIGRVLDAGGLSEALTTQLATLRDEIAALRRRQRVILGLLEGRVRTADAGVLDKAGWVAILRATGLGDEDMDRWHAEFEAHNPTAHADFLRGLGLAEEEIDAIRAWSSATS